MQEERRKYHNTELSIRFRLPGKFAHSPMPGGLFRPEAGFDQSKRATVWLHNRMELYTHRM